MVRIARLEKNAVSAKTSWSQWAKNPFKIDTTCNYSAQNFKTILPLDNILEDYFSIISVNPALFVQHYFNRSSIFRAERGLQSSVCNCLAPIKLIILRTLIERYRISNTIVNGYQLDFMNSE